MRPTTTIPKTTLIKVITSILMMISPMLSFKKERHLIQKCQLSTEKDKLKTIRKPESGSRKTMTQLVPCSSRLNWIRKEEKWAFSLRKKRVNQSREANSLPLIDQEKLNIYLRT